MWPVGGDNKTDFGLQAENTTNAIMQISSIVLLCIQIVSQQMKSCWGKRLFFARVILLSYNK